MKNKGSLFFSLVLMAAIFSPSVVCGLGIRIPDQDQDPAAKARGNAFAATVDYPSAIFYKPAGITQLEGMNARVGSRYEHWRWDVACQPAYGPERNVTGSTPNFLTGESGDGRYEFISHALTFSIGCHF